MVGVAFCCGFVVTIWNSQDLFIMVCSHTLELLSADRRIHILLCLVMSSIDAKNQIVRLLGWIGNSSDYEVVRFYPNPSGGEPIDLN